MDKMKRYFIYVLLLVLFAIFTEFLINVGLNSTYNTIQSASNIPENVVIYQSEATAVNGRIRGMIKNNEKNPVEGNYLKFDFFSKRDINLGSKYIDIDKSKQEIPFEAFFKLENVAYYKMAFVDQKDSLGEIEFIPKDFSKSDIFWMAFVTLLIWP